jgi:hypothetical protein
LASSNQLDSQKFLERTQEELEKAASSKLDNAKVRTVLALAEFGRSTILAARRQAISEKATSATDTAIDTEVKIPINIHFEPELGSASFGEPELQKTKVETTRTTGYKVGIPGFIEVGDEITVKETFEIRPPDGGGGGGGKGMGDVKLKEFESSQREKKEN